MRTLLHRMVHHLGNGRALANAEDEVEQVRAAIARIEALGARLAVVESAEEPGAA